eukprot:CAMPEP_0172567160 /NCGR_PEP_ID=MMETSP1067-20121228/114874_1 /TAXON_ID=265564 ORGANISM="Thalassiosira punctigera, Strain Tpunct2005C2" /NCGR_SAMPLE_ID=MMETSP1067 /ASSEMBLY_ACC=CAM_ASM_000444 /LENGTH=241 /DNA_ID=CAMNT_0013358445 /DNA_START=45 /DNA_END=766 /DNA_ORIENTATION=+
MGEMGDDAHISRFHSCMGNEIGGELRCIRSQQQWESTKITTEVPPSSPANETEGSREKPCNCLEGNDWGVDNGSDWGDDGEDDWGGCGVNSTRDDDISMDDLETMLTHCEMQSASKEPESTPSMKLQSTPTIKPLNRSNSTIGDSLPNFAPPSFEQHDLEMIDEPPTGSGNDDSDDDDDDDAGCSASKVDQMLSRYLEMEDDVEILSALKGGGEISSGGNDGGNSAGGGERYERLPPDERA